MIERSGDRSLISSGKSIREFLNNTPIFDIHEHLLPGDVISQYQTDFTYLLPNYASTDLLSSGMKSDNLEEIRKPGRLLLETLLDGLRHVYEPWEGESESLSINEKWETLEPYWQNIRLTGYGRCIRHILEGLFGIKNFNLDACRSVSDKVKYLPNDWQYSILKDKCNIQKIINDIGKLNYDDKLFRHAIRFDHFMRIASKKDVAKIERELDVSINSLDGLLNILDREFQKAIETGTLTIKTAIAYERSLEFTSPNVDDARKSFNNIIESVENCTQIMARPLQDYIMNWISRHAAEASLPIQIHTGLQEGPINDIRNSNPVHLIDLFRSNPETIYIIMHAGYPFCREYITLVKTFPNVYADLSWVYMISPSAARQVLHELIDTVPINKLLGFGGDSLIAEWTYGHLQVAKEIIFCVLLEKLERDELDIKVARELIQRLFWQNANDLLLS